MGAKNTQFNTRSSWFSEYVSGKYVSYHSEQLTDATPTADPQGMTASGGIISEYIDDEDGLAYRSHSFTRDAAIGAPQAFTITSLSPEGDLDKIDYLVIGGGAGGGKEAYPTNLGSGGGGAGLLRYKAQLDVPPSGVTSHPITVGRGGHGGGSPFPVAANVNGQDGTTTTLNIPWGTPAACPGGGGGGGHTDSPPWGGSSPGGSGGGGRTGTSGSSGAGDSGHPNGINIESPANGWGNDGGSGGPSPEGTGAGGGGAAAVGTDGSPTAHGPGGNGARYTIANGTAVYYAGGGGGGGKMGDPRGTGGQGGGGNGSADTPGNKTGGNGVSSFGGGGGAKGEWNSDGGPAYNGAPGAVIIRYRISETFQMGTAKATGGHVSFYNSKTIHTFTSPGTFATASGWSPTATVEYVAVGGGGGAGSGGGGAGQYLTNNLTFPGPDSFEVTVGLGGNASVWPTTDDLRWGRNGKDTSIAFSPGTITAVGGGGGGGDGGSPTQTIADGQPGGSGGGGAWGHGPTTPGYNNNGPGKGGTATPGPGGNPGGHGWNPNNLNHGGGGGGGAGGAGSNSPGGNGGHGGAGIKIPSTFQDPASSIGWFGPSPDPGSPDTAYWVAGGGAGQDFGPGANPGGGAPPGSPYMWSGGGNSSADSNQPGEKGGWGGANTGGGGGGSYGTQTPVIGGQGGSGVVLIAYPT